MSLIEQFPSLGFIGAGNMAGAIVRGVLAKGLLPADRIVVCDALAEKARELGAELGVGVAASPAELVERSQSFVLATKPQDLRGVVESVATGVGPDRRVISIAAGVSTGKIEGWIAAAAPGATPRVVRVMPNTPALVGAGAAGVAGGAHASAGDVAATLALFEAVGVAAQTREEDLDAVTALSGSGPAYVFLLMEALQAAGEEMGLDAELARRFTLQTFLGAALLAQESGEPAGDLRRKVTSPGGTTAAALKVFEDEGLAEIFRRGVRRAQERSRELAKGA